MSHYLKNLVMRSLEESSGLNPRPATRYESVRQNPVAEFPESTQERSFPDLLPWTAPIETAVSRVENIIERRGQTGESLPSEPGRESIRKRRQNQSGLLVEKSDEGEITKRTSADLARPLHEVSQEGAAELVSSVPRPNTALSDHAAGAAPRAQRSETLPGMRSRAVQQATVKSHPPSAGFQEVSSDLLQPTLNKVSFQPARGETITAPTEARAPVVQIRIGRIEVRAVAPPVSAPNKKSVEPPGSSVSLDQYLKRRSQET